MEARARPLCERWPIPPDGSREAAPLLRDPLARRREPVALGRRRRTSRRGSQESPPKVFAWSGIGSEQALGEEQEGEISRRCHWVCRTGPAPARATLAGGV